LLACGAVIPDAPAGKRQTSPLDTPEEKKSLKSQRESLRGLFSIPPAGQSVPREQKFLPGRTMRLLCVPHYRYDRTVRKLATMDPIVIENNSPEEWQKFSALLDCVPDPMVIRTAELFLNGRSGCARLGPDAVWQTIDSNLHGLLTFFNMLMTRPAIPLIDYFATIRQDESMWPLADQNILALFHPLDQEIILQVTVSQEPYVEIRNAAWQNLKRLELESAAEQDVSDLASQMAAYQYDWHPSLGGMPVPENRLPLARFLLGGLIFGAYAQAADADHVIQNKRSQLFLALTRPEAGSRTTGGRHEEDLFVQLKETCARADNVRFSDLPALPSILADILLREPPITRVSEILPRAIEIRHSRAGAAYRAWFKKLRTALGEGRYATDAEHEIEEVRKEAEHRLKDEYSKWGMSFTPTASLGASITVSAEAPGASAEAKASLGELKLEGEKIRLAIPDWIRNMVVDHLPFRRHRKLLLRSALAQAEFQDVSTKLKKIWLSS
jgi:hypothetical protein